MTEGYDVQAIRSRFPALQRQVNGRQAIYFDGPGGSQVVGDAIEAMTAYMRQGGANLHGVFPSSVETEAVITQARQAVAALLNTEPSEIAFGANMTSLNLALSRALSRSWQAGDEIVVTELDHRANVDPWRLAARDRGVSVRFIKVRPDSLTLDLDELDSVISERTRLVAIGLSSNAVGTVSDVRRVADAAHVQGALVAVDAVHGAPHLSIDREVLGADILLCSAYKFFGPHVGIAALRTSVFDSLEVYKLQPAPDYMPDKLETGTQNHEGLAGVTAAVNFITSLGHGDTQRARVVDAMGKVEAYEHALATALRQGLADLPGVTVYAAPPEVRKTPTVAFRIDGVAPREVCARVLEHSGVFIADGDFYASTLVERLGLADSGGFVRAGLAPYNTAAEVEVFLDAVRQLVHK